MDYYELVKNTREDTDRARLESGADLMRVFEDSKRQWMPNEHLALCTESSGAGATLQRGNLSNKHPSK